MNYLEVILLSFIEGLTEFLPISSTGHLIVTSALMNLNDQGFVKSFNIIIQFGAILSVLVIYWRRFIPQLAFYKKLLVSFLPAAVIGLLVKDVIDRILGSSLIVAWALIAGGIILIWSDRWGQPMTSKDSKNSKKESQALNPIVTLKTIESLTMKDCLILGFFQCFAFVPGVSRAGATIVGGLLLKLSREEATKFSFFLAVPTLTGAAVIKSAKILKTIEPSQIQFLLLGTALSFVFALISIKFFIRWVSKTGFTHFGIYRIIIGIAILIFISKGVISP